MLATLCIIFLICICTGIVMHISWNFYYHWIDGDILSVSKSVETWLQLNLPFSARRYYTHIHIISLVYSAYDNIKRLIPLGARLLYLSVPTFLSIFRPLLVQSVWILDGGLLLFCKNGFTVLKHDHRCLKYRLFFSRWRRTLWLGGRCMIAFWRVFVLSAMRSLWSVISTV